MTDTLANYAGNKALAALLDGTKYLALFKADPTAAGALVDEFAGAAYARQPITFAAATNKTRVSNKAQLFPGLPAGIATHLAVFEPTGDNMIFAKALSPPITVLESGQFLCAAGDVALSI